MGPSWCEIEKAIDDETAEPQVQVLAWHLRTRGLALGTALDWACITYEDFTQVPPPYKP